ncbi:hypothetical protein J7I44_15815 [Frateuria sp. MAH-13]|uniref:Uncharacterized protein n=1 Tax=Frateuria flava TaxID=2821489 RepID=A0ABS4DRT8_9GAMM|nr:hypothetical protein [Frateuria flava]MBP1475774.1 hypothetical protein [Frateuria flava]
MMHVFPRPLRPRLWAQAALVVALLGTVQAPRAQVLVTDPTAIAASEEGFKSQLAQSLAGYARQGMQYAKQLEQYYQQVEQLKQLLMTIEGLGRNISFASSKLEPIDDPTKLIDQNCPGASGGSIVGALVTSAESSISSEKPILLAQQQICANITMLHIDEYNRTVAVLKQLDEYGGTLQKLNKLANEVRTLGTTSGATTQAATISATTAFAMQQWQTAIAGDEAVIKTLNQQQSMLAKAALRGQINPLGTVVQAAALKAAFSVD